jgi:hypothetical protein
MCIDRGALGMFGEDLVQLPEQGDGSPEGSRDVADGGEVATSHTDPQDHYRGCDGGRPGKAERREKVQHLSGKRKDEADAEGAEYDERAEM